MTLSLRYVLLTLTLPALAADITIDNRTFHLPAGFTIETIAAPPLVNRPITADFDEQGPRPPHIPREFHLRPHHHCDSLTSTTRLLVAIV
jgi:hypothetical protein